MTGLLLSRAFVERFGVRLASAEVEAGGGIEHIVMDTEAGGTDLPPEEIERVEAAFLSNDVRYDRARFITALHAAPNLRWLHVFSVGVDRRAYPELRDRGVVITNSPGANAEPIALTTLGAILWLSRAFPIWADAQKRHAWEPVHYDHAPPDLTGQVMVVLGIGEIGGRIARLARAIGLHVVGVRRGQPSPDDLLDECHHPSMLHDLLPRADWLTVACPLTDETRGLIGEREFSLMPRGSRLINVARGAIVEEAAMIEALRSGHLGGAYLDVFAQEPLVAESPLWDFPNVLITPHNAAISSSYPQRSAEAFFANLVRWKRGEPLRGVVG